MLYAQIVLYCIVKVEVFGGRLFFLSFFFFRFLSWSNVVCQICSHSQISLVSIQVVVRQTWDA